MSTNREHKVDRLFREGLGEGNVPPPVTVWRNVAAEVATPRRRRRGGLIFFFYGAAAAGLFAAIAISQGWFQSTPIDSNTVFANQYSGINSGKVAEIPCAPEDNSDVHYTENPSPVLKNQFGSQNRQVSNFRSTQNGGSDGLLVNHSPQSEEVRQVEIVVTPETDFPKDYIPGKANKSNIKDFLYMPDGWKENSEKHKTFAQKPNLEKSLTPNPDLQTPLQKTSSSSWMIAGNFAPDFSVAGSPSADRNIANENSANLGASSADFESLSESSTRNRSVTAYSTGLRVGFAPVNRVQVQTGLNYANRTGEVPLEGDAALATFNASDAVSIFSQKMLEVPLLARYEVISGKNLRYFVSSGMSAQWLLKSSEFVYLDGREFGQDAPEKTNAPEQINLILGTGIEFLPVERIGLQIEPMLRYGIMQVSYPDQSGNPLGLSLNTGFNIHF